MHIPLKGGILMLKQHRKGKLVVLGAVILVAAAAAYAYWTNSGSGSGSAETGTNAAITINQTSTVTGLAPGGPPQALSGNFTNSNSSPVFVTSVNAAIGSVTGPNITAGTPCDASDYQLSGFPIAIGRAIPSGSGVDSWSGSSIQMINKPAANQDGCKNATVNISYTSN
jgi:hypothetical protein